MLNQLPTSMIPGLWSALLPFLERACRHHPLESPINLLQKCLNGKAAMCIESDDGMILTVFVLEAYEYPDKVVCLVSALSGRPGFMNRLPAISEWVDEWARLHGCTGVAIMGRPGWARVFNKPGVEQVQLVVAYRSLPHVHDHPGNHGDDPGADRADGGHGRPAESAGRHAAFPATAGRAH